jgi:hypothetical protein
MVMNARILIPLLLIVTGCGITGPGNVTLQLQGTVTDASTGLPVVNATVDLFPPALFPGSGDQDIAKTTSDAQGHYYISHSVDSKCLGNGFGFAITAESADRSMQSDGRDVGCTGVAQQIDLPLNRVTP